MSIKSKNCSFSFSCQKNQLTVNMKKLHVNSVCY